ncbi:MAG: IPT/TIG domain-containing protein [Bacteroidota bacterium]|nr:IPT/TIG domain-containing protein [Bacteroidota bacterium]
MRKLFLKYMTAGLMACLLLGSLTLTSCDTTNEASEKVELKVFGPSPALRGGELEFIGLNLDKVTAIILPENIEVTVITVISPTTIKIVIPQDAKPGKITLKTPDGDILTKTDLSFSEPISIGSITPLTIKAGDEFTINGDYLNLIKQVIFNDNIVVDSSSFNSQTRYQIKVTVPKEAQSGKIIISNGQEIPILVYSDTIVAVTLPALTGMSPNPVKPGENLTVSGTDFQLIKSVIFADNLVDSTFVSRSNTSFTVKVPAAAKVGRFKLVAYSQVEVQSSEDLKLVAPVITGIAPNPVKSGQTLTITGTDLDLATTVTFGGSKTGNITTQTATSISVTVPETAVEGKVVLSTKSGQTAESANLTFIKPAIATIAPLSLTAGGDITITGTNLDLVKQVIFGGGLSVDAIPASSTSLTVTTPTAAVSGKITLVAKNGDLVESTDELTLSAANKPVITSITFIVKPGALLTITGTKLHLVRDVVFQNGVTATDYGDRTSTKLEVYVPTNAKNGKVTLTLKAYDGSEVVSPEFTVSGTDPITADTKMIYDFNVRTTDWHAVDWDNWGSSYDAAACKALGYIVLVSHPGWWVLGCNHPDPNGGWPSVNSDNYVFKVDIKTTTPIKITGNYEFQFMIGGETLSSQLIVNGDYITTGGEWATLTIPIAGKLSNPTLSSGNFGIVLNSSDAGTDFAGLCFDNMRFDPK